ncbi:LysR family transcriptional regulator [soil metagenome]
MLQISMQIGGYQMRSSLLPIVLRYVDQVARSGSIQGAAKELHVAASAINRQILQLEDELGVPLFERVPRGMRLTASGDSIVTLARRWRNDERRAASDIRQLQGINQGHVTIAAMDSHSSSFLPGLVREITDTHPKLSLSIEIGSTDEGLAALMSGKADVAAVFNPAPRRDLHVVWSSELPFGCIVAPGHPLAQAKTVSLQEVCSYPVALQSKSLQIRRYLESHYSWLLTETQSRVETNSLQLVKMLVKSGGHVAFTSELDAASEIALGSLVFVPVRDKGVESQTVSLVIDAGKPLSLIVKLVSDLLVKHIQGCLDAARPPAVCKPAG